MQPRIKTYPGIRIVNEFPPFPDNPYGLRRGSYILTNDEDVSTTFHVPIDWPIPLCYDGNIVRCNTIGWEIDALIQSINKGLWEISDRAPVPAEQIPQMEFQMGGGQVTARDFWTKLWHTQKDFPEQFRLRASPDVSAADLKAAAATAGKKLFIHAEIEPAQIQEVEGGRQVLNMDIGNSDAGVLDCQIPLSIDEILSGDRFFLCQITS